MKIGVVARCDHRGLGLQTYEFWRNMPADKALVIIAGVDHTNGRPLSPYQQRPERYDKGWVRLHTWNADPIPDHVLHDFLDGLDLVYVAETPYDYRLYELAKLMKVKVVCHVNPEFYRHGVESHLPQPDAIWLPSVWLADRFPPSTPVLPFPVNRTVLPFRHREQITEFLHVVGHRASRDRNGTQLVYKAFRRLRTPTSVLIRSQDKLPRMMTSRLVKMEVIEEDVENYADLYTRGDVMVLPRRYGGNCLPLHEALSCGIPVLMPKCSPQSSFLPPEMLIDCRRGISLKAQIGLIATYDIYPDSLARRIEQLINEPELMSALSKKADELAQSVSWDVMRGKYRQAFGEVASR